MEIPSPPASSFRFTLNVSAKAAVPGYLDGSHVGASPGHEVDFLPPVMPVVQLALTRCRGIPDLTALLPGAFRQRLSSARC